MNIKNLKQIDNIERNTNKMKVGVEYILENKDIVTTITRNNKKTLIFKNYKMNRNGELDGPYPISKQI